MPRTKKAVEQAVAVKFTPATVNDYDVILKPVITEKSMKLTQDFNKITVKVAKDANSTQIKNAFESIFNKKVARVNIVNVRAKDKRVGRYSGLTSAYKKAIITLKKGETLDLFNEGK